MGFRRVLKYYVVQMKKYPKSLGALFIFYSIAGVLVNTVSPLLYKKIIDITVSGSVTEGAVQDLFFWIWILGALLVSYNIFYRIGDYFAVFFESNVLRDLSNDTFSRLHNHSYAFFADNFSGSLVSKTKRFVGSFSNIFNNFFWHIAMRSIQLLGSILVLFWSVPIIGGMYLIWIFLFILLSLYFARKKMPYDLEEASMDSKTIARYADTVTNAVTIKMFGSKERESSSFQEITSLWERARRKAWNMRNYQIAIQGVLFVFLEFGTMYFCGTPLE